MLYRLLLAAVLAGLSSHAEAQHAQGQRMMLVDERGLPISAANPLGSSGTLRSAGTTTPDVDIIHGWNGDQMIGGGVTAQTLSGATVLVKRSRGALLLSAGPFETAPSTALTIRVICN